MIITEIAGWHHSKRPDRRERAGFGAAQLVLVFVDVHAFPLVSTRHIETGCEDIPRIAYLVPSRIGWTQVACVIGARIDTIPHTSPPARCDGHSQVFVQAFGRPELSINVRELSARVA